MGRFKARSKTKMRLSVFILVIITYLAFIFTFRLLFNVFLKDNVSNDLVIDYLLSDNSLINSSDNFNDIFNVNLTNPENLVNSAFNSLVSFEVFEDDIGHNSSYIEDPNPTVPSSPRVYIYNTHQTEAYASHSLTDYNIDPNVMMASYLLREKLNDLGIETIVETGDITKILRDNEWSYSMSYEASKILINNKLQEYGDFDLVIDIHRDSSVRDKTTTVIDGKNYAKILFVVGKEHENYQSNLDLANYFNEVIKSVDSSLSRGIYIKEGPGVNGIYNQDLSSNAVLLELGGQYNTIEEAANTVDLLADVIFKMLGELDEKK